MLQGEKSPFTLCRKLRMGKLRDMLGVLPSKTPFQKGKEDASLGKPAPSFPTADSPWSDRLYNRGYLSHFINNPT
jgi:hypothetical protein